jgi:hypothetical protein
VHIAGDLTQPFVDRANLDRSLTKARITLKHYLHYSHCELLNSAILAQH